MPDQLARRGAELGVVVESDHRSDWHQWHDPDGRLLPVREAMCLAKWCSNVVQKRSAEKQCVGFTKSSLEAARPLSAPP